MTPRRLRLRGDLLHATDVQVQGLDLAAGLASLQAATSTAAASSAGLSTMAKVGVGAVVAVGAVALWLGMRSPELEPEPGASVIAAGSESWAPRAPKADAPPEEPVKEPVQGSAHDAKTLAEPVPTAEPDPQSSSAPIEGIEGTAAKPIGGATSVGEPAARRRRASKSSRADAIEPVRPTLDDSVLREARMVAKARAHLTGDPQRALALVQQAEKEFPYGQLVEERRAIAIQALVALGRKDDAHRQADAFLPGTGAAPMQPRYDAPLNGMP